MTALRYLVLFQVHMDQAHYCSSKDLLVLPDHQLLNGLNINVVYSITTTTRHLYVRLLPLPPRDPEICVKTKIVCRLSSKAIIELGELVWVYGITDA